MNKQKTAKVVILENHSGLKVTLSEHGARITSIKYQNKEMLVTYPTAQDYTIDPYALGATCGRVANRIEGAQFELGGKTIELTANDGEHCLHGGFQNFANQKWQLEHHSIETAAATFTFHSPDGDQGFPGELIATAGFSLEGSTLVINYKAHTNKTTPIDLTNHCYFNLAESNVSELSLTLNASKTLAKNDRNVPSGEIHSISGDLVMAGQSVDELMAKYQKTELVNKLGFDHYFVFDKSTTVEPQAVLQSKKNNISMSLYTNQLGLQLYTAGSLGRPFKPFSGICLEAQNYPNAVNINTFPSPLIGPNDTYHNQIKLAFSNIS